MLSYVVCDRVHSVNWHNTIVTATSLVHVFHSSSAVTNHRAAHLSWKTIFPVHFLYKIWFSKIVFFFWRKEICFGNLMKNMFSFVQKVFCILTADPMSTAYSAVNMTTLFVARCWVLMKSQEQQILLSSATDNSK